MAQTMANYLVHYISEYENLKICLKVLYNPQMVVYMEIMDNEYKEHTETSYHTH